MSFQFLDVAAGCQDRHLACTQKCSTSSKGMFCETCINIEKLSQITKTDSSSNVMDHAIEACLFFLH